MMDEDLKELLRAFNAHAVKYLVVGGYACGVHLEPRTTKDLDLFIRSDEEIQQSCLSRTCPIRRASRRLDSSRFYRRYSFPDRPVAGAD